MCYALELHDNITLNTTAWLDHCRYFSCHSNSIMLYKKAIKCSCPRKSTTSELYLLDSLSISTAKNQSDVNPNINL